LFLISPSLSPAELPAYATSASSAALSLDRGAFLEGGEGVQVSVAENEVPVSTTSFAPGGEAENDTPTDPESGTPPPRLSRRWGDAAGILLNDVNGPKEDLTPSEDRGEGPNEPNNRPADSELERQLGQAMNAGANSLTDAAQLPGGAAFDPTSVVFARVERNDPPLATCIMIAPLHWSDLSATQTHETATSAATPEARPAQEFIQLQASTERQQATSAAGVEADQSLAASSTDETDARQAIVAEPTAASDRPTGQCHWAVTAAAALFGFWWSFSHQMSHLLDIRRRPWVGSLKSRPISQPRDTEPS
jgi:hypothetical protein